MTRKLTDDQVLFYIESKDCEWVSGKYENNASKLKVKFSCGCVGSTSFCSFKKGNRCYKHGRIKAAENRRMPIEEISRVVVSYGFLFNGVVGNYIGRESIISYSCKDGHVTERVFNDFATHPNCKYCMIEDKKVRYRNSITKIDEIVSNKGCCLIDVVSYKNRNQSALKIEFSCGHLETLSLGNFQGRRTGLCVDCELESRQGETAYAWRGGITQLSTYLRTQLKDWNIYCAEYYSYKCVVTGLPMEHIHHLYSFNLILKETLETLNIEIGRTSIKDYSDLELDSIVKTFFYIQNKHPISVPITKTHHHFFHRIYGRGNNTPEQFYEFVDRIKTGEIKI